MEEPEQERPKASREALEKEAFQLAGQGKMLLALKKLEQVIQLDQQWYHFFYKALWLWQSNKIPDAAKIIEYGLNFENSKEFYFLYLSAEFLFRVAIAPANVMQDSDKSIAEFDQALRDLDKAEHLLIHNQLQIQLTRGQVPEHLKQLYPTFLNVADLTGQVRSLRTRIEMTRQSTILFKGIVQAENRVNVAIERNRERIQSERVRTIELLGIFTAIFAFIFSGVQIFTRLPLSEALVLQGGMALLMILFFLGVHLVIQPEARTKVLIAIFIILFALLLGLPFYVRLLSDIGTKQQNSLARISKQKVDSNGIESKSPQ